MTLPASDLVAITIGATIGWALAVCVAEIVARRGGVG